MPAPKSREWLDQLLEGHEPSSEELRQLVQDCPREDQWIEYKAGPVLGRGDPAALIREYVAGFANADGGAFVVGYRHADHTFDGARAPGGGSLKDWASRALTPIRTGSTLPEPRFAVTPIDGVEVLLVSIGRARMPVADIRSRMPVFFVRMGDQTLEMPHWLVTDLLLGRRAQPDLRVTNVRVWAVDAAWNPESRSGTLRVSLLYVDFENDALTLAEGVRCGLVSRSTVRGDRSLQQQLRRSIDLDETIPDDHVSGGGRYPWGVQHIRSMPAVSVEPFEPGQAFIERWALPLFGRVALPVRAGEVLHPEAPAQAHGALEAMAALYLIAKKTEPSWWQLTLRYDVEGARQLTERGARHLRFEPCLYSRPVVSLRFLAENEPVEFPE